jgi:hypothetical protein
MELSFSAEVIYWRGPAPFLFARLPAEAAEKLQAIAGKVSYGWGCIPVTARVEGIDITTALMPREGTYVLPLKIAARKKMRPVDVGDTVNVWMRVGKD